MHLYIRICACACANLRAYVHTHMGAYVNSYAYTCANPSRAFIRIWMWECKWFVYINLYGMQYNIRFGKYCTLPLWVSLVDITFGPPIGLWRIYLDTVGKLFYLSNCNYRKNNHIRKNASIDSTHQSLRDIVQTS